MQITPIKKTLATLLLATLPLTTIQAKSTSNYNYKDKLTEQIQNLPYNTLEPGVAQRWVNIRQKVQTGRGCPTGQYISWDYNGNELGFFKMPQTNEYGQKNSKQEKQDIINQYRSKFENSIIASTKKIGYPFVADCSNEHQSNFENGIDSYYQTYLTGSWHGHTFKKPTNVRNIFKEIYKTKKEKGEITFPENLFGYTVGQYVFEAGGKKKEKSNAGALGIMQIIEDNLKRVCKNPMKNPYHRIAQIECAFTLHQKHYELLKPNFEQTFQNLPKIKKNELISLLTLQSYHTGQNGINKLLDQTNPQKSKVAKYLSENHENYSAADLAFMFMFHNYGKSRKLQSLKYTIDARNSLNELQMRKIEYN
jgi:hypothetical protein